MRHLSEYCNRTGCNHLSLLEFSCVRWIKFCNQMILSQRKKNTYMYILIVLFHFPSWFSFIVSRYTDYSPNSTTWSSGYWIGPCNHYHEKGADDSVHAAL